MFLFRKTLFQILIAGIILLLGINSYARVDCPSDFSEGNYFCLQGEITVADVKAVEVCIREHHSYGQLWIYNSSGGDIYAAMNIGRLLRKNRIRVVVPVGKECLSACPLILAGAVDRGAYGEIGIHRSYSLNTGIINFEEAQKKYNKTRSDIKNYLSEMNIPASFFATMERIPPEEMRYLSKDELKEFGIYDIDPVEQEIRDANQADIRGISKQEYLQRLAEAKDLCKLSYEGTSYDETSFAEMHTAVRNAAECKSAVSWGLTTRIYINRHNLTEKTCGDLGEKHGRKSKEYRTCYRNVMLGTR